MIDKFQRIARSMQALQLPLLLVGSVCLVAAIMIVLGAGSVATERFLMPSLVGFIWAATTYSFIVTFRTIPEKADQAQNFSGKLKRRISRGWYWFIAVVFIGTTVAAVIFTSRLISIWVNEYTG